MGRKKYFLVVHILRSFSNWAWEDFQVSWNNIHPCMHIANTKSDTRRTSRTAASTSSTTSRKYLVWIWFYERMICHSLFNSFNWYWIYCASAFSLNLFLNCFLFWLIDCLLKVAGYSEVLFFFVRYATWIQDFFYATHILTTPV